MPQLKAAEILAHPEFGKVPWEGKATKEGFVKVAKGRGGPIPIAYEIHGTGPNKLVVSGWNPYVESYSLAFLFSRVKRVVRVKRGSGLFTGSSRPHSPAFRQKLCS